MGIEKLYIDELKKLLNSSIYVLEKSQSNVVFDLNDTGVVLAKFKTALGEVEFIISYWMYEDGPAHRDVFLYHDGTKGKKFSAIHPADITWIEMAAATAIDLADVAKLFTKGEKNGN